MASKKLLDNGIQICEIEENRSKISSESDLLLIPKNERKDLLFIITECVNNGEPAWYYGNILKFRNRAKISVVTNYHNLPLEQRLIEGYTARANEDIEITKEFAWAREKLFEFNDKEG